MHWREAWKYGERAFRYCNHDVGHAIGSTRIAAATLGWKMTLLDGVEQNTVALLLGTNRVDDFREVEPEHPDCLAVIWPEGDVSREADLPLFLDAALVKDLAMSAWHGKANLLSRDHAVHWDAIDVAPKPRGKSRANRRRSGRPRLRRTMASKHRSTVARVQVRSQAAEKRGIV